MKVKQKAMDAYNDMLNSGPGMTPSDPADNTAGDTMDLPMLKPQDGYGNENQTTHEGDVGGAG